jgi:hypothetical protein
MFRPDRRGTSPSADRPIKSADELAEERRNEHPLSTEERSALLGRLQEDIAGGQRLAMQDVARHLGVDLKGVNFRDFQAVLDRYYLPQAEASKKQQDRFDRLFRISELTQEDVDRAFGK